jgi:Mn2+/Fe2+ NRAMP family transporter
MSQAVAVETENSGNRTWAALKKIGPAFVSATTIFGPASLLLAALAGALYRYSLMWVVVLVLVERLVYFEMGTRLGIMMPHHLLTTASRTYNNKWIGIVGGIVSFLSSAPYAAGNVLGCSLAAQLLLGGNLVVWAIGFMIAAVLIFFFRGVYQRLEKIALIMVALMLVTFLATLAFSGFSAGEAAKGLIPGAMAAPPLLLAISIFSTNQSAMGFTQVYFVRGKKYTPKDLKDARFDHILSSVLLSVITAAIMAVGAEVLNPAGIVPTSAPQAARMLEPLVGSGAKILFGLGLFGAAFTSLSGHPVLNGITLGDAFQRADAGADSRFAKITASALVIVMGLFGILPVAFGWQAINIYWICALGGLIGYPFRGIIALSLAKRKDIMKDLAFNKTYFKFLVAFFVVILGFVIYSSLKNLGVF